MLNKFKHKLNEQALQQGIIFQKKHKIDARLQKFQNIGKKMPKLRKVLKRFKSYQKYKNECVSVSVCVQALTHVYFFSSKNKKNVC